MHEDFIWPLGRFPLNKTLLYSLWEISLYTPTSSEEEDEDDDEDEYQPNEKKEEKDDSDVEEEEENDDDDDDDDDDIDCEEDDDDDGDKEGEIKAKAKKVEEMKSETFLVNLLETVGIVKHLTSTIGGNMVYIYKNILYFCLYFVPIA